MRRPLVRHSRFLSLVLRHRPELLGLELDSEGWTDVSRLLQGCERHGVGIDVGLLAEIVATNDKRRFSFSEDGCRIRASQGHSLPVQLEMPPLVPPEILFHGTAAKSLESILRAGLSRRARNHVHLSPDPVTARQVGMRHGTPVVLAVAARRMHRDGSAFFQSANGVWLTESVPPQYLTVVGDPPS